MNTSYAPRQCVQNIARGLCSSNPTPLCTQAFDCVDLLLWQRHVNNHAVPAILQPTILLWPPTLAMASATTCTRAAQTRYPSASAAAYCPGRNRRVSPLSALRANTNAPQKPDSRRRTLRPRNRPGRARAVASSGGGWKCSLRSASGDSETTRTCAAIISRSKYYLSLPYSPLHNPPHAKRIYSPQTEDSRTNNKAE
jgi:hypothetical protein